MRIPKNHKIFPNPDNPVFSRYTHPPQPSGGAMEFAPALTTAYPPVPFYGGGVPVSSYPSIDIGPSMRSTQTALSVTVSGSGVAAGQVLNDNPLSDTNDLDSSAAEYDQ